MATAMASMDTFVAVQYVNVVSPSTSATTSSYRSAHVTLGSSIARFGGLRLDFAHNSAIQLVWSIVVVDAEEGVVDRVENAVGGATKKLNDTALATNDKVQDAASKAVDFMSGKADEAHNATEDVLRDVQRNADKVGNKAAIAGNAKSASSDARSKINNIVHKARNAAEDASDSIKKNFNKATDIAQNIEKDVQWKAENVGDSACDTARNMKRCQEGC